MQLISGQLVSVYTALLHSIVNRQEMLDTVTYTYKWSHIIFFLTFPPLDHLYVSFASEGYSGYQCIRNEVEKKNK